MKSYVCEVGNKILDDCGSESCSVHAFYRDRPKLRILLRLEANGVLHEECPEPHFQRWQLTRGHDMNDLPTWMRQEYQNLGELRW